MKEAVLVDFHNVIFMSIDIPNHRIRVVNDTRSLPSRDDFGPLCLVEGQEVTHCWDLISILSEGNTLLVTAEYSISDKVLLFENLSLITMVLSLVLLKVECILDWVRGDYLLGICGVVWHTDHLGNI